MQPWFLLKESCAGLKPRAEASGPTSLPTRSARTADCLDSSRRHSIHSKDVKPKLSSPRHAPVNAHFIDARFDDVRCSNTAMKRVGRDPRPRRARNSPDGRSDSKGLGNSGKGPADLRQPVLQRTRPGEPGRAGSSARTPLGLRDARPVGQMKPTAQGSKHAVGRSSLSAMQGRVLQPGNGAGSLKLNTGVGCPTVGGCRADASKRAFSRGDSKRGVWR